MCVYIKSQVKSAHRTKYQLFFQSLTPKTHSEQPHPALLLIHREDLSSATLPWLWTKKEKIPSPSPVQHRALVELPREKREQRERMDVRSTLEEVAPRMDKLAWVYDMDNAFSHRDERHDWAWRSHPTRPPINEIRRTSASSMYMKIESLPNKMREWYAYHTTYPKRELLNNAHHAMLTDMIPSISFMPWIDVWRRCHPKDLSGNPTLSSSKRRHPRAVFPQSISHSFTLLSTRAVCVDHVAFVILIFLHISHVLVHNLPHRDSHFDASFPLRSISIFRRGREVPHFHYSPPCSTSHHNTPLTLKCDPPHSLCRLA